MWWTEQGERTLKGAERELFIRMADALWIDLEDELAEEGSAWPTGIAPFDRLSVQQRFVVLGEITAGLLDPKVRFVPLTQANEAAIAAVYRLGSIQLVDCELYEDFRQVVRAVVKQHSFCEPPALDASNADYAWIVQQLRDLLLWDTDFALEGVAMDLPADKSRQVHEEMGIADDYFTAVVADPRDIEPHRKLLTKYLKPRPLRQPKARRKGPRRPRKE